jgi:predicted nucleic acid-binding protein
MRLITSKTALVSPTTTVTAATDPDDNMFLECAEEAEANYLVTGNKKHFPAKWKQTKVVSGREMMTLMLRGLLEL